MLKLALAEANYLNIPYDIYLVNVRRMKGFCIKLRDLYIYGQDKVQCFGEVITPTGVPFEDQIITDLYYLDIQQDLSLDWKLSNSIITGTTSPNKLEIDTNKGEALLCYDSNIEDYTFKIHINDKQVRSLDWDLACLLQGKGILHCELVEFKNRLLLELLTGSLSYLIDLTKDAHEFRYIFEEDE